MPQIYRRTPMPKYNLNKLVMVGSHYWNKLHCNDVYYNKVPFVMWTHLKTHFLLLPPIRVAEIIECVRKYVDRISQNLQILSPY